MTIRKSAPFAKFFAFPDRMGTIQSHFLTFPLMTHTLPQLPYAIDALEPYISRETIEYHHGKHHQTYVDNLNKLIIETPFETLSLEEIIKTAPAGAIFNNAAQIWNHTFYFEGLTTPGSAAPSREFAKRLSGK